MTATASSHPATQQRHGADCLQRTLVPRSRFRQQLRPGVIRQRHGVTQRAEGAGKNCGAALNDEATPGSGDRVPCPACGSKLRRCKKERSGSVSTRGGVRGVASRVSKSKWLAQVRSAPSFHRCLGIWAQRLMSLNKKADSSSETITNPATGAGIPHGAESLSEHTGHGSARPAKHETDVEPIMPADRQKAALCAVR